MASSVDQQSRSHSPTSQSDLRPHECNLNNVSSFECASRQRSRERTLRQTYARESRSICSDTLNPGGDVQICSVGCILGMPEISPFVFIVTASRYMGFPELKKCFFKRGCFGCGGISHFFGTSVWAALILERPGGANKPASPLAARDSSSVNATTPDEGNLL